MRDHHVGQPVRQIAQLYDPHLDVLSGVFDGPARGLRDRLTQAGGRGVFRQPSGHHREDHMISHNVLLSAHGVELLGGLVLALSGCCLRHTILGRL